MSIRNKLGRIRNECINKSSLNELAEYVALHLRSLNSEEILNTRSELYDNREMLAEDAYCRGYASALMAVMSSFCYRLVTAEKCHYEEVSPYPSNRCQRVAGHRGDHKLSQDTGYARGKMVMYWECGECGTDIGPNPGRCPDTTCGYTTAYYMRELQKFKVVEDD